MTRDLISPRTRRAFQDHLVGWVLREITAFFEDEGVALDRAAEETVVERLGQRRALVAGYYATVDWRDQADVGRVLRVFECVLLDTGEDFRKPLVERLRLDGYRVTDEGRIQPLTPPLPVKVLTDANSIEHHLERMTRSMDSDPALAISQAKAAVEATTKLVLKELGQEYEERADVPALVKQAQKALGLHPDCLAPGAKGEEIVKRMLSNLGQLAVGLAELRNEYGPDHGRTSTAVGLKPRHAHLAAGAAHTLCRMLLETLEDPAAPWRAQAA